MADSQTRRDRAIVANELPYTQPSGSFGDALQNVLAFSPRDWGADRDTAYVWAIVFGWDDETGGDGWDKVAAEHGWSPHLVAHLKRLHVEFVANTGAGS